MFVQLIDDHVTGNVALTLGLWHAIPINGIN